MASVLSSYTFASASCFTSLADPISRCLLEVTSNTIKGCRFGWLMLHWLLQASGTQNQDSEDTSGNSLVLTTGTLCVQHCFMLSTYLFEGFFSFRRLYYLPQASALSAQFRPIFIHSDSMSYLSTVPNSILPLLALVRRSRAFPVPLVLLPRNLISQNESAAQQRSMQADYRHLVV